MVTQNEVLYINEKHILKSALIALKEQNGLYLFEFTIPEKHLVVGMVLRGQTVKGDLLREFPFTAIEKYLFDITNIHFTISSNEFREENKKYIFELESVSNIFGSVLPTLEEQNPAPVFDSYIQNVTENEIFVFCGGQCIVQFQASNSSLEDPWLDLIVLDASLNLGLRSFSYNYSGAGSYRCLSLDRLNSSTPYYYEKPEVNSQADTFYILSNSYVDELTQAINFRSNAGIPVVTSINLVDENLNLIYVMTATVTFVDESGITLYASNVPTELLSNLQTSAVYLQDPETQNTVSNYYIPIT
jgi:hypothetical protein